MYLIDTNVVSEARCGTREAVRWLKAVDPDAIHLSVVTLGEIMRGIAMKAQNDPPSGVPSLGVAPEAPPRSWRAHPAGHRPHRPGMGAARRHASAWRRRWFDRRDGHRPRPHHRHPQCRGFRRHARVGSEPLGQPSALDATPVPASAPARSAAACRSPLSGSRRGTRSLPAP